MDFFHFPIKIISRNKRRSAVAASAYISGTRMENTWDGTTHDYTRKLAPKSRLVYDLDENGERIPARQKGRWKTHKENIVDWDNRGNAEVWRAAAPTPSMKPCGRPDSRKAL